MKRPQVVALGVFSAFVLAALLAYLQVNLRSDFPGDLYEHELTGEIVPPWEKDPPDFSDEAEGLEIEVTYEQEPPELDLPTGQLYADRYAPSFPAGSGIEMGESIVCDDKALIPLYPQRESLCVKTGFLTLAEAVESGKAKVYDSGSVQTVFVVNESDRPVFLMSGEVVFGGKQDRVIAQDTVIPADKDRKYHIGVFCVEKNRWHESERGFAFTCKPEACSAELSRPEPEPQQAPEALAQATEDEKWRKAFQNLAGRGITCACILAECGEGGQGEVWSRVGETNKRLGTDNSTNTYRNNLASEDVNKSMESELVTFGRAMAADDRAIGYVFMYRGNVLYVDIFGSPELFAKYKYGLIKAYLIDTVNREWNPRSSTTASNPEGFLEWVETRRLAAKSKPGYAFYRAEFLAGSDCTYEGKRLHSGYYHDGLSHGK